MKLSSIFRAGRSLLGGRLGHALSRYGLAVMLTGMAVVIQLAISTYAGERYPFPAFYAAVALATWLGGRGPGLLALVLGYLGEDWFIVTPYQLNILTPGLSDDLEALGYTLVGLIIVGVIARMQVIEGRARRAVEEVCVQRGKLEAVLKQMPVGVIIAEAPSGHLVLSNEQAEKILGHSFGSGRVDESQRYQGFHPDGRPYELHEWPLTRSLVSGESVRDEEIELLRGNGSRAVILVSSSPIRDHQGRIVSAVKSFQDITLQKRAQQAQARLAAIVESSDDAILGLTMDATVTTWNRGADRVFGYSAGEMVGRSVSILLPPERSAEKDEHLEKLQRGERIYQFETVRLRKDGRRINVSLTISLIHDSAGLPIGISTIARDITARKRTEEALRVAQEKLSRHAEDLAREVAERTVHLRETIQSLEGVCYHIAHDLRAPLRAMQGFTTLLLRNPASNLDAGGEDFAQRIDAASRHMDQLIGDLLDYGRLGHASLTLSRVDLERSVNSALRQLAGEIRTTAAEVQVTRPLPAVWANASMLNQVLINLLGNALKFVKPGEVPRVHISAEEAGDAVCVTIQDNGIGVPAEHHERIFGVFERLPTRGDYPGTGIGLAIVQKAVQRMGGRVWMSSEPGKGSCFCVALPKPGRQRAERDAPPDKAEEHRNDRRLLCR